MNPVRQFAHFMPPCQSLACEDANSKLVKVVTVADVNAEDHVDNSLLHIWELTFGPKAKLLFRL